MKKHIPNVLTLIRLFMVPFFLYFSFFLNSSTATLWAAIIFILASITDYFDGMLARKFNAVTNFGKIMDPLADKILVITALLALSLKAELLKDILVWIILTRELLVSIFREIFARKKIFIAANIWGKIKTFMQMIGIIGALIYLSVLDINNLDMSDSFVTLIFEIYFWIVALITWISGLLYFFVVLKLRKS